MTPEERFLAKVSVLPSGCWQWTGCITRTGYGLFRAGGRLVGPHCWAFEHWVGVIPAGFTVDHECHNTDASCVGGISCPHRSCVNPEHLAAVTQQVNILRSRNTMAARHAAATHCPQGHEYTPENTYVPPKGGRNCRSCRRTSNRVRQSKMRALRAMAL